MVFFYYLREAARLQGYESKNKLAKAASFSLNHFHWGIFLTNCTVNVPVAILISIVSRLVFPSNGPKGMATNVPFPI